MNKMKNEEILNLILEKVTSLDGKVTSLEQGQKSDRELLEMTAAQVNNLTTDFREMKTDVKNIDKTVMKIEHEHGKKLSALFDGYKQNSDKLERIEKEVTKHEEFMLRRIK